MDVKKTGEHELTIEWDSSASNDMIADSTVALITSIDKSPASVKCRSMSSSKPPPRLPYYFPVTSKPHSHSHDVEKHPHSDHSRDDTRISRLAWFLEAHFRDIELHMPTEEDDLEFGRDIEDASFLVVIDEIEARINLVTLVRNRVFLQKNCSQNF